MGQHESAPLAHIREVLPVFAQLDPEEKRLLLQRLRIGSEDAELKESSSPSKGLLALDCDFASEKEHPNEYSDAKKSTLQQVAARPGNQTCADCSGKSSTWVSVTHGVFLCSLCAGAHRALGSNVSFVQSTTLDDGYWTEEHVEELLKIGNAKANDELEFFVPAKWPKPHATQTPGTYRREYVKAKYQDKLFSRERNVDQKDPKLPIPWSERKTMLERVRSSTFQGKIEYIGIVGVRILRAQNLMPVQGPVPLADAFYTNPYVNVRIGAYQAQTKHISRTLNPVWNEGPKENLNLNMSWDGVDFLQIIVQNHEKFAKDRLIGAAIIDIQELGKVGNQKAATAKPHGMPIKLFDFRPQHDSEEAGGGEGAGSSGAKHRRGKSTNDLPAEVSKALSENPNRSSSISEVPYSQLETATSQNLSRVKTVSRHRSLSEENEQTHEKKKRPGKFEGQHSFTKLHLRGRMRDAFENVAGALQRKTSGKDFLDEDLGDLGAARRERGFIYVGKLYIELSFIDLR